MATHAVPVNAATLVRSLRALRFAPVVLGRGRLVGRARAEHRDEEVTAGRPGDVRDRVRRKPGADRAVGDATALDALDNGPSFEGSPDLSRFRVEQLERGRYQFDISFLLR
jgi:hypothetical protein